MAHTRRMNPKTAIETLRSLGWTDHRIGVAVGVMQSTIWRLRKTGQPSYDTGSKLVALAKREARKVDA